MVEKKQIIKNITDYLINVIEVPRQEFSGFAVCPFSKSERVKGRLMVDVLDHSSESFLDCMNRMTDKGCTSAVLALFDNGHPVVMDKTETVGFSKFLNKIMKSNNLRGYKNVCLNPNDEVEVADYNPRSKSPYFLIVVSKVDDLDRGRKSLTKTKYYNKMPEKYKKFLSLDL
tara:strand:- start:67 stop:582 length:516 start_codon:yes stop_codon:yes gene_type:complete